MLFRSVSQSRYCIYCGKTRLDVIRFWIKRLVWRSMCTMALLSVIGWSMYFGSAYIPRTVYADREVIKEVVISTGYRTNYTFTMESPDASLVHLFNNLYTFQFELSFETNEYQIFEILKSNIINKLEYYFKLGGKMNIVNTMLRNIKETM